MCVGTAPRNGFSVNIDAFEGASMVGGMTPLSHEVASEFFGPGSRALSSSWDHDHGRSRCRVTHRTGNVVVVHRSKGWAIIGTIHLIFRSMQVGFVTANSAQRLQELWYIVKAYLVCPSPGITPDTPSRPSAVDQLCPHCSGAGGPPPADVGSPSGYGTCASAMM